MLQHFNIKVHSIFCQVVAYKRLKTKKSRSRLWSVTLGSKFGDVTWQLLVLWKMDY